MSTVHIIRGIFELAGVLLAAYAVYRLMGGRDKDKPQKPSTEAYSDKAVVFTGRDFFSID